MNLFDVHAHLQDVRFSGRRNKIIQRSLTAGVTRILCCGVQETDWPDVARLADTYPSILPAFGLHPWFIGSRSRQWLVHLEEYIRTSGAAVGEIGLDRTVSPRNDADQIQVFTEQLHLANKYECPVNIHCRNAFGLLADLLEKNGGLPHGGVIHSYSGSAEMAKKFEKLGAYISFSGSVTRPRNKKVKQAARAVSLDRLLIETDAPDILPTGAPKGLNEPAHVVLVLAHLAELRPESIHALATATFSNATTLLKLREHDRGTKLS